VSARSNRWTINEMERGTLAIQRTSNLGGSTKEEERAMLTLLSHQCDSHHLSPISVVELILQMSPKLMVW